MKRGRIALIVGGLLAAYAAYFGSTILLADFIFPPAQQSLVFQHDVLEGRLPMAPPNVIILGDSTSAFGYSAGLLPRTLSLAVFSGSFAEIYQTLRRYLDRYDPPKCIVLTASYNWAYHRDNRFWDIYVVNGFYDFSELADLYDVSKEIGDFPALEFSKAGFLANAVLYRLRLRGLHMADLQDALLHRKLYLSNIKFNRLMHENMGSINKTNVVFPFIWEPHSHLNEPFVVAPMYDEYLGRLVKLANSKGIRVRWIQSPISKQVMTPVSQKFYADLNDHLRPIVLSDSRNTYDGTTKIYDDSEMFSATHLNTMGAHRFTEEQRPVFEECQ